MAKPNLIPCLRYRNAPEAIEFLCRAFGLQRHFVLPDESDASLVVHAELTFGDGMLMLGSARDDHDRRNYRMRTPGEAEGVTATVCLLVDDVDAHHARAAAAGAHVIAGPYDNDGYPGRSYEARDPEGFIWIFTTYAPRQIE